jgi:hypothetical protein
MELKTTWDFVEKYYPNYYSCDEILRNNDLSNEIEEGRTDLENEMNDSNSYVFNKAIEAYIETLKNPETKNPETKNFVNGFTKWTQTFFEIVSIITDERYRENGKGKIKEMHDEGNISEFWELAVDWTNEFEKLHEGETWTEKDWWEELDNFFAAKNKL